jgi:predicted HTH transcriptional regulator
MKPVHEWNEDYILSLPLGEFDWLEVKGRQGLDLTAARVEESKVRQNLSVALSACANSGGGTLIFGLKDPKSERGKWEVDDGGVSVSIGNDTREWLETIIPHLVDYPLAGFNVYVILPQTPTSQIQEGRGLFVIEIPDSPHAPHQAQDKQYYVRVGGRSRSASHRLVMDMMGRRQHPQLELDCVFR